MYWVIIGGIPLHFIDCPQFDQIHRRIYKKLLSAFIANRSQNEKKNTLYQKKKKKNNRGSIKGLANTKTQKRNIKKITFNKV